MTANTAECYAKVSLVVGRLLRDLGIERREEKAVEERGATHLDNLGLT